MSTKSDLSKFLLTIYFILLLIIHVQSHTEENLSPTYRRLASIYCYVDDYSAWIEQQTHLQYFLQFAQFFQIDSKRIELELERYRLQRECLRALERLPILVGGG